MPLALEIRPVIDLRTRQLTKNPSRVYKSEDGAKEWRTAIMRGKSGGEIITVQSFNKDGLDLVPSSFKATFGNNPRSADTITAMARAAGLK